MFPYDRARCIEQMLRDGLITPEQHESALNWTARRGGRGEDAVVAIGAVDEIKLLEYLAGRYETQFASADKLYQLSSSCQAIDKIPRKLAVHLGVFPIRYDAKTGVLQVVTADPDNPEVTEELKQIADAREVKVIVARPEAVQAAIRQGYEGDAFAFRAIDHTDSIMPADDRMTLTPESYNLSRMRSALRSERTFSATDLERSTLSTKGGQLLASPSYLETVKVLVTLLEKQRGKLCGHSAKVARLIGKMAKRIGLSELEQTQLTVAAYSHDLGKTERYHLTPLNVAQFDGHRKLAAKTYRTPAKLMEAASLPREVVAIVEGMYEQVGGGGIPEHLSGKEIPLGSRLLAIADTYTDLTQSANNPFRKVLSPAQACQALNRYRGQIFDPDLLDLFRGLVTTGADLKARLLDVPSRLLLIDPNAEEAAVLELRLLEQGFDVQQTRTTTDGQELMARGGWDLVVCEMDLEPEGGLVLLDWARKQTWGVALPWVFVTRRSQREDVQRAFDLKVLDVVNKPVSAELLATKLKQMLEREAARQRPTQGVSGSLLEMSVPELVQVLHHGRKTGALKIRAPGIAGEVHFVRGEVYTAVCGEHSDEEAVYALLAIQDGEFHLDPSCVAQEQRITSSPEGLLLEGMCRLDESSALLGCKLPSAR